MPRLQDVLFGGVVAGLLVLIAYDIAIGVAALAGAFLCGALTLLAGMVPARGQSLPERLFISGFLAVVLSSLVLIVPGTMGAQPSWRPTVLGIAAALPLIAMAFEMLRTPRVLHTLLRLIGAR